MQQRHVGSTGLKVSRLGLGTMTWGRDTDEHEARDQLVSFVEAGGTLVDTAAGYANGDSERVIGTLLREVVRRDDVVLATKAGIGRLRGERETNASRGFLISSLDASLKRLQVDHVDLWQVHTWVDDAPVEETLSALDYAVATGRASYVGISNYTGWQSAQAATWQRAVPGRAPIASNQVEYSLLARGVEAEVIPAAQALGLGILPWSPLGRGVLTGKYRTGTPADSRAASTHFASFVGPAPQRAVAPDRRGGGTRRRGVGVESPRGRARLGARPSRSDGSDRRRPHRRAAQGGAAGRGVRAASRDRHRAGGRLRSSSRKRRRQREHDDEARTRRATRAWSTSSTSWSSPATTRAAS